MKTTKKVKAEPLKNPVTGELIPTSWKCDVNSKEGIRTLSVTLATTGGWEITSSMGVSPWVASSNGCHSFSTEAAAMSIYDHVCGDQKWKQR
jgi:hypothetical protein